MLHAIMKIGCGLGVGVMLLGLAGCAESMGLSYPSLAKAVKMDELMSPEQREEEIKKLTLEQQNHGSSAVKEIEKKN